MKSPRTPARPDRAVVQVGPRQTIKRYRSAVSARAEARWYELAPWAAPPLLRQEGPDLVLATLPVAKDFPSWRPVKELHALLVRLHDAGIHHRDVHVGNIVMGEHGQPLLIDWETALARKCRHSYDLHGPDSGVPVPSLHRTHAVSPQWWGASDPASISVAWRCDVPAAMA